MKTLTAILLTMSMTLGGNTQERNIETESVSIDNLIAFMVSHFQKGQDSTTTKNITFLIETHTDAFLLQDEVILKQAFKLLTDRLTDDDTVSIVMHSHINGIALNQIEATAIKDLLYAIEHPKKIVKTLVEDGVELAYAHIEEHFMEDAENSVVMIRLPNQVGDTTTANTDSKTTKKKGNNALVMTAIALLPELISVIKD